jgi:hypothetical protein
VPFELSSFELSVQLRSALAGPWGDAF